MLHHRQSLVCEGQLLEFLAAKLVAKLHAVFQQYLRLSQARVHAWRKCMGREKVGVRERERERGFVEESWPRILIACTGRCKCVTRNLTQVKLSNPLPPYPLSLSSPGATPLLH